MSSSGAGRPSVAPDFGPLASTYDQPRPVDANWLELLDVLVDAGDLAGRRLLDVGSGTGRLAAALADRGARVWGVDTSQEMLAVARASAKGHVGFKHGNAERLPFKDAWFERVVFRLVVHLVDRPKAFSEATRVLAPDGRIVVATFDPEHFSRFWLNAIFPSIEQIDRERFPEPEALADDLATAGFDALTVRCLHQEARLGRTEALERIRGGDISTLHLLTAGELETGLARAETELPAEVRTELRWIVVTGRRP